MLTVVARVVDGWLARRCAAVAILALVVGGCAQGPAVTPSPPPESVLSSASMAPTAPASMPVAEATAAAPTTITSVVYPYSLVLPAAVATTGWNTASRSWNGTEGISSDAPYNDGIGTTDGALFVFGTSWSEGLDAFTAMILSRVAQEHGCGTPDSETATRVGGAPATLVRQECGQVALARILVVHAGTALAISEQVDPGREAAAGADLAAWFTPLVWRPTP